MRYRATCYRGHDPRWAFTALSGEGASLKGGRFNPRGQPALYLASTVDGLIVEMTHGFAHRLEPLTVCEYEVDVDGVVDLRTDAPRRAADVDLADLACDWELDVSNGREAASWRVATRLVGAGASGILVPSFARGARPDMHNLVLWRWGPEHPYRVEVYDPSGRLPNNQLSWESPASR